jgi:hypothetical protein
MKRPRCIITMFVLYLSALIIYIAPAVMAADNSAETRMPKYIVNGLQAYAQEGYEAAVRKWFQDSPWANATILVERIAFFKNIEMLYGPYQGYQVVTMNETATSQMTYIRFVYSKMAGYVMFLSKKHNNQWALVQLDLHKLQKYGDAGKPLNKKNSLIQ